jgi:hypothetical protein
VTTSKDYAFTALPTSQITIGHSRSSHSVALFTSRCLVAASSWGRSTSSAFPNYPRASATSFSQQQLTTAELQQSSNSQSRIRGSVTNNCSRFDDWVYWTPRLQVQLIITVHTLNSFLVTNLSLYFLWFSDWFLVFCYSVWLTASQLWLLRINYVSFYDPVRTADRTQCLRVSLIFCLPLPSNGLFRVATGTCSVKLCPADGHIVAFRRHVTSLSKLSCS